MKLHEIIDIMNDELTERQLRLKKLKNNISNTYDKAVDEIDIIEDLESTIGKFEDIIDILDDCYEGEVIDK